MNCSRFFAQLHCERIHRCSDCRSAHLLVPADWNQKWRKPLRDSLNTLRDRLAGIFKREGGKLLRDPWKARDDYIAAMNSSTADERDKFLASHSKKSFSQEEKIAALKILESQRNALFMFTSCGWFFDDISGLESVQLLKYAARAIELAGEKESRRLEDEFLSELIKAKSNLPNAGTGADIYQAKKKFSSTTPSFLAGQYVISSHLSCPEASPEIFGYSFNELDSYSKEGGEGTIYSGFLEIESSLIPEVFKFGYFLMLKEDVQVICLLKEFKNIKEFKETKKEIMILPSNSKRKEVLQFAVEHFGGHVFSIRDLFPEDSDTILTTIADHKLKSLETLLKDIYIKNREFLRLLSETSLTPPQSILIPARTYLERSLSYELKNWQKSLLPKGIQGIRKVTSDASYYGIDIDKSAVSKTFSQFLLENVKRQKEKLIAVESEAMIQFVNFCGEIDVEIETQMIQNEIFAILNSTLLKELKAIKSHSKRSSKALNSVAQFIKLAERFNFNTDSWKELLQ